MQIIVKRDNGRIEIHPVGGVGSYSIGTSKKNLYKAFGRFLIAYQNQLGLEIIVDPSAQADEDRRREKELSKR